MSRIIFPVATLFGLFGMNQAQTENPTLQLNEDDNFSFQLLSALALAPYGGSDIAPVLAAATELEAGNFTSYSNSFYSLANSTKEAALDPDNSYDPVNVRDAWFAAATYFRQADFYLHGDWTDPLIETLWDEQLEAFDHAIAALPIPGRRIEISADNFTIEAIWYAASGDKAKRPTMIVGNGYDGAQEDLYSTIVVPALARGWNCITYEGPGQPTVRRRQQLGFIPDWERVVTPVVDYVLTEESAVVDPSSLVLFGFSFGGYLAARAAAFEPRLSAVVLDGGIYDAFEAFSSQLPPEALELFDSGNKTAFDGAILSAVSEPDTPTTLRWGVEQGTWAFKIKSPFDFLESTKEYTIKDVVDRIDMPVLVMDAEFETFFAGQAEQVSKALGSRGTYHVFKGEAGYHCQLGAFQELNRVMFAWIHKKLGSC